MKRLIGTATLIMGLLAATDTVSGMGLRRGHNCGSCDSCYTDCAPVAPQYVTVQRTVYKMVAVTVEQEITECQYEKMMKKEKRVIHEQVMKDVKQKVMVPQTVWVERECTRYVCEPVTTMVERKWTECQTVVTKEKREIVTCQPVMKQEPRTYNCTTYKQVPELIKKQVCSYEKVPVTMSCCNPCDPCNPILYTCYQCVPVMKEVACTVMHCVPETVQKTVMVNVCSYVQSKSTIEVPVCHKVLVPKSQMVPVTTMVSKPVVEKIKVPVCQMVPSEVMVKVCELQPKTIEVDVVWYQPKEVKRKVPVTTYKCVPEVINVCVPACCCN